MGLRNTWTFLSTHPLTRRGRGRAGGLARLAWWQVRSRLWPGPWQYRWIGGTRVEVRGGETGFTGNIYAGLHEFEDMAFVLHALRPGDQLLDIGANVGAYTLLAAGVVGANALAVEPIRSTFARLERNVALNALGTRVRTMNVAITDVGEHVVMTSDLDTMNRVASLDAGGHTLSVPARSLDRVAEIDRPTFMKIDVEGHERHVLAGARATIAHPLVKAVIVEISDSDTGASPHASAMSALRDAGFTCATYDPWSRSLSSVAAPPPGRPNALFVRDWAFVAERVKGAPTFRVHGRAV